MKRSITHDCSESLHRLAAWILLMRIRDAQYGCPVELVKRPTHFHWCFAFIFTDYVLKRHLLFVIGKEIHKTADIGSNENQKKAWHRFFLDFQASIVRRIGTSLAFVKVADREFRLILAHNHFGLYLFRDKKKYIFIIIKKNDRYVIWIFKSISTYYPCIKCLQILFWQNVEFDLLGQLWFFLLLIFKVMSGGY